MQKTIQELRNVLHVGEKLTTSQLCFFKGGDGEDIRRPINCGRPGGTVTSSTSTTTNGSTTGTIGSSTIVTIGKG
jgi:hypothetical protein